MSNILHSLSNEPNTVHVYISPTVPCVHRQVLFLYGGLLSFVLCSLNFALL